MVAWQNSSRDCKHGVWKKCPHDNNSIVLDDPVANSSSLCLNMNSTCLQERVLAEDLSGIKHIGQSEGFLRSPCIIEEVNDMIE